MKGCKHPEIVKSGACLIDDGEGKQVPACKATLREKDGQLERRYVSVVLSRPEHYLSLYQSGCNLTCGKCHSAEFSQAAVGSWLSVEDLAKAAEEYTRHVNVQEPRERWTMFHAEDLCRGCGSCVLSGQPSSLCPRNIKREQVLLSGQGLGPARNIVAFTGGDLSCRPEYYAACARAMRERAPDLHVLVETNAVALDREGLEVLKQGGVEAFWLDIKAYHPEVHQKLTGFGNQNVLAAPGLMHELGFTFEVLSLYIPGLVETDQLVQIAELTAKIDAEIPFTVLAFFPTYRMKDSRSPTFDQMMEAGRAVLGVGIKQLRLGNIGTFCKSEEQIQEAVSLGS